MTRDSGSNGETAEPNPADRPDISGSRDSRRLLIVVNVGWFFVSHRLPVAVSARLRGYEVHVACDIDKELEELSIRQCGFQFHRLRLKRAGRSPVGDFLLLVRLVALFRRVRPDVIHLVTIKPVIFGGLAARVVPSASVLSAISGLGYVFASRTVGGAITRSIVRAAYRIALAGSRTTVLFQNEDDRATFVLAGVVPANRTALIRGSGVDLRQFRLVAEPSGTVVVVLAARMLRDKGIAEFLGAAELLRASGSSARLVLVGGIDPENPASFSESELLDQSRAAGVEWWGHRTDMPGVFASAHIVCLPSYREGLPKALLEAAASGRPMVATNVPGCREICRDGETGLLVPPRDPEALAGALERLILDRSLRLRMGRRAREVCEAEFGVEAVVTSTLALYER